MVSSLLSGPSRASYVSKKGIPLAIPRESPTLVRWNPCKRTDEKASHACPETAVKCLHRLEAIFASYMFLSSVVLEDLVLVCVGCGIHVDLELRMDQG